MCQWRAAVQKCQCALHDAMLSLRINAVSTPRTRQICWLMRAQEAEWTLAERGGDQGDYRAGIRAKIANTIECLQQQPLSKRAVRHS